MQILNSQEVHFQPTDTQFGPSKFKAIVVFLIVIGLFTVPLVATFNDHRWIPFAFCSFIGAIVLLVTGTWVIRAFKKDGWKIVIQNSTVLLKANITGKDSQDILEIQFREIASLRKIREKYIRYKGGKSGDRYKPARFDSLDIQLIPDAYAQLEMLIGAGTEGLEITPPNRLIYPTGIHMLNAGKVLRQIETYCRVQESQVVQYDRPDLKDKKQVDRYILFLARRGHKMDAEHCAGQAFGFGLRESSGYVANLLHKTP